MLPPVPPRVNVHCSVEAGSPAPGGACLGTAQGFRIDALMGATLLVCRLLLAMVFLVASVARLRPARAGIGAAGKRSGR